MAELDAHFTIDCGAQVGFDLSTVGGNLLAFHPTTGQLYVSLPACHTILRMAADFSTIQVCSRHPGSAALAAAREPGSIARRAADRAIDRMRRWWRGGPAHRARTSTCSTRRAASKCLLTGASSTSVRPLPFPLPSRLHAFVARLALAHHHTRTRRDAHAAEACRIRVLDTATLLLTTLVGTPTSCATRADGPLASAVVISPYAIRANDAGSEVRCAITGLATASHGT